MNRKPWWRDRQFWNLAGAVLFILLIIVWGAWAEYAYGKR